MGLASLRIADPASKMEAGRTAKGRIPQQYRESTDRSDPPAPSMSRHMASMTACAVGCFLSMLGARAEEFRSEEEIAQTYQFSRTTKFSRAAHRYIIILGLIFVGLWRVVQVGNPTACRPTLGDRDQVGGTKCVGIRPRSHLYVANQLLREPFVLRANTDYGFQGRVHFFQQHLIKGHCIA